MGEGGCRSNHATMAKMSKSQFIAVLSDKTGLAKKQVKELWEVLVAVAYKEVKSSGELTLPGIGKLVKKNRPKRTGRNPQTGATIEIPAKTVLKFRVAKAAKEAIL